MIEQKFQEYRQARAFLESPLGRAITRFENAALALHTYEGYSLVKSRQLLDDYTQKRDALIALFQERQALQPLDSDVLRCLPPTQGGRSRSGGSSPRR